MKKKLTKKTATAVPEPPARPHNVAEEQMVINAFKQAINCLESVMGPNLEVVLHDLRQPHRSTLAIANGHVTGRQVGDPIIAAPKYDKGFSPLLGSTPAQQGFDSNPGINSVEGYTSRTRDGRELRSTTVFLRNDKGEAFATVCANFDLTVYQQLHSHIQKIVQPPKKDVASTPARLSVDELIEEIIAESLASIGKPVVAMDTDEKVRVIQMMVERGLFVIKGSAERVASRLGVSRFTVYNYLGKLKDGEGAESV
jgi:predicted transcriptional regulator YheO